MMMLLLFGAMYFLFIRPNKRRRQQIEEMQRSIGPGDEVLTLGGLYGIVSEIDDDRVVLEVSPGSFNTYSRSSISRVVNAAPSLDEDEVSTAVDLDKTNEATAKKVIDTD
jgi:preprotein translocase subunit YajC